MALTRVSRHIIDDPFNPTTVSATDVTATNINASGIGTVGTLRVTGDLTVEGTTTTLDSILTEVDRLEVSANSTVAAGIITQTGSGDILNLFDGSTEVFTVTDGGKVGIEAPNPSGNLNISYLQVGKGQVSSDHSLYNYNTSFTNNAYQNGNGTFAHITNRAVGVINIQDNVFKFLNGPGGTAGQSATLTERFTISSDGNIGLAGQTNPTDSLHIGDFATVGYELKLSRNALQFKRAGNSFIDQKDDAGHILFRTTSSNTERLRITSDGKIRVPDNGKFTCGASDDLQIYHTGSHSLIDESGTGNLVIRSNLISFEKYTNEQLARFTADGSCEFYYDNSKKLETTSDGATITGELGFASGGTYQLKLSDNQKIRFGGGNDLQIYHNGTHSYIDNVTNGALIIRNTSDDVDVVIESDDGSGGLANYFRADGSTGDAILYHYGAQRLHTTSTGINVVGVITADGLDIDDSQKVLLGTGDDLQIYHNGSGNYIDNTSSTPLYIRVNGSETAIFAAANGKVGLNYDGSSKFETTTTGAKVTGALEVTQEYPSIRPTLDLNFAATKTLDRRITFTRDSLGTYIDQNGVLKYASNNVPRFDHDPVTGESLGLLIEKSRTNILYGTPSQANTVNTYNLYNSLTGEYNATRLAKNTSTNSQSHGSWNWNGNLSTTSFVISVFVKKINHASFFMQVVASGVGDNLYVYYNIDTGVTSHTDYTSPGNLTVTKSIENYPDGWFRLVARVEGFSNAALHSGFRLGFAHPTNNSQQYVDSSDEVLVFGAQAEVGDFVTSYIPTHESTTSVTRASDSAVIKGTNFTDWYNQSEGTFVVESNSQPAKAGKKFFNMDDNADGSGLSEMIEMATQQTDKVNVFTYDSSTTQSDVRVTPATTGRFKAAARIKQNDVQIAVDGTLGTRDTSASQPSQLDRMIIGNYSSGDYTVDAPIARIAYYNKGLVSAQLQGLTQQ